jgi:hypothetical protein
MGLRLLLLYNLWIRLKGLQGSNLRPFLRQAEGAREAQIALKRKEKSIGKGTRNGKVV